VASDSWLLLVHQLPPNPSYLRVKVWRRLQALGAVALKNSVYLLPNTDEAREDFEWVLREIRKSAATRPSARRVSWTDSPTRRCGASSCRLARRTTGRSPPTIRTFAREAFPARTRARSDEARAAAEGGLARFRKRLAGIAKIDFFGAPGREAAEGLIARPRGAHRPRSRERGEATRARALTIAQAQKRTWVTRKGIHIDRIACAWLIRRFIDEQPTFKFVPARGYTPAPRELRFDMFDAEFTHDGDLCSFEVMLRPFALKDQALRRSPRSCTTST
jgi:hypothetical protein